MISNAGRVAHVLGAQYEARAVRSVRGIEDSDDGLRVFIIETPDGHRLIFGTDLP